MVLQQVVMAEPAVHNDEYNDQWQQDSNSASDDDANSVGVLGIWIGIILNVLDMIKIKNQILYL